MAQLAKYTNVAILNAASLSAAVPVGKAIPIGILIPAAWTTANITFQASVDDTNFVDVYNDIGTELSVTVGGAARFIALDQTYFLGFSSIKIRSGTTGTPVAQAADRVLTVCMKEF
jgi:hypothetical protein